MPEEYFDDEFKPVITNLNNKFEYFATKPEIHINNGAKNEYGLEPVSLIPPGKRTQMGIVRIYEGQSHSKAGTSVPVCKHHILASARGINLQVQKHQKNDKTCSNKEKEEKRFRFEKASMLNNVAIWPVTGH